LNTYNVHAEILWNLFQAFMERLGLWGEGAPYRNFEQFLVSVQKKGLGEIKSTWCSNGLTPHII
jgi:hypothetical protein